MHLQLIFVFLQTASNHIEHFLDLLREKSSLPPPLRDLESVSGERPEECCHPDMSSLLQNAEPEKPESTFLKSPVSGGVFCVQNI